MISGGAVEYAATNIATRKTAANMVDNLVVLSLCKGLSGSSVGGEMEASSQQADIELTLPFGSSNFISCSDRSS